MVAGCDSHRGPILASEPPGDTVYVWITLRELPATLTFNQAHVTMLHTEYAWSIVFDTDGNGSFETSIALMHFKFSDTPEEDSLLAGTQHDVWEIDSAGGGTVRHRNVVVRIDAAAPTRLEMALPRSWPLIGQIDEGDRFYVRTFYNDPAPPSTSDGTAITTGTGLVTDALNDVGYGFVDIVSARWSRSRTP
jgi:hypothetical protein